MEDLKIVGWADFDSEFPTDSDDNETLDLKIELLKEELATKGYVFGGEQHQYSSGCMPVYSDGTGLRFSMRAWGLIMAMVRGDIDGIEYPYMHFYMSVEDSILPEVKEINIVPREVSERSFGLTIKPDHDVMNESLAFGMKLMTTDKILNKLMELQLGENEE